MRRGQIVAVTVAVIATGIPLYLDTRPEAIAEEKREELATEVVVTAIDVRPELKRYSFAGGSADIEFSNEQMSRGRIKVLVPRGNREEHAWLQFQRMATGAVSFGCVAGHGGVVDFNDDPSLSATFTLNLGCPAGYTSPSLPSLTRR